MKSSFSHLVAALILSVGSFAGYGGWYAFIADKSASVALLENQIDTKAETVSRAATAQSVLAELEKDEAVVQNYFVPEAGVVAFINELQTEGKALGATVKVLSVSTSGTPPQSSLVLILSIKGTFDAVMRTVGAFEYDPYAVSISTLSVGQDAKNAWHADLTILVGSMPANAVVTAPPL